MQNYESNQLENFPSPPVKKDVLPSERFPISPDNPPWSITAALLVWFASVAFIIVVPNFFVLPYVVSQGVADQNQLAEFVQNDPTVIWLSVLAVIPAHVLTLALAWAVVTRFNKFSFRETLGWRWNGFSVWNCLIILGGFYILAAVVSYFIPEQENDFTRILKSSRTAVYVVAFVATFTAPLIEEVIYRGVLYSAMQRSIGVAQAIIAVTAIFAGVHFWQYWGSPGTLILVTLLSLTLVLVRARTKNLLPCVALHTIFNGSQSLLMILQPYIEKYTETQPSPETASFLHFFK